MIELRKYQLDLLERAEQSLAPGNARVMMQLPTGAGKTVIAAHMLRNYLADGRKAMWITHRRELAAQTRKMLRSSAGVNVSPQATWERNSPAPHLPNGVVIVMAQTASRRAVEARVWDRYSSDDFLIVDEAHHATARGWERIIRGWPGRVLGMTATPWRLSIKEGFDHLFGDLICGPQVRELQADGFLCDATVVAPPDDELIQGGEIGAIGDYTERGIEQANPPDVMTANALRFWRRQTPNRWTIAYAVSVNHAYNLASVFNDAGVSAKVMLGATPPDERAGIISDFETGKLRVLINVAVATEGFDLPDASCVMIARPTTSLSLYLQMVGRGLRPKPNGGDCVILDLAGNAMKHGLPETYRTWTLSARGAEGDGDAPAIRCEQCYTVSSSASHNCRHCGDPFGKDCGRCGRWRAWKRWSLENACEYAHDAVCDLCHADAHVQARLPVTDDIMELANQDEETDMPNVHSDLDERLSQILRELLEDERERALAPHIAKREELRARISRLEESKNDDVILEAQFQEYLSALPLVQKPATPVQERRIFGEWEANRRAELAALRDELAGLEYQPINENAILGSARDKLLDVLSREADAIDLIPVRRKPEHSIVESLRVQERDGWVPLTELRPKRGQSPLVVRLPSGEEIPVNRWPDVLVESANWLVRESRFSEFDCPFVLGKSSRYFINRIPEHPDGRGFKSKRQMQNGMFILTHYNPTDIVRNSARLLREFGGDPSRFYVKMR